MSGILTVVLLAPSMLPAQNRPGIGDELVQKAFHIDYAAFVDSLSDDIYIEVYYKVFSSVLTFEKRREKFKGSYEVDLIIKRKGKQVTGASRDGDLFADDYKTCSGCSTSRFSDPMIFCISESSA